MRRCHPFARFLISPQTSWKRFVNPQFFFTYNLGDAAIDNHVLRRAGSYGKQLGKILDVLDVLVRHMPADALTTSERRTIEELVELRDDVERAKREFREEETGVGSCVDVDRLLASWIAAPIPTPTQLLGVSVTVSPMMAKPREQCGGGFARGVHVILPPQGRSTSCSSRSRPRSDR
jgi:hypothetical protein